LSIAFLISSCTNNKSVGQLSLNSGSFIDSKVDGLTYKTATQEGQTNGNGTFYYKNGETVSFYIGDVLIGTSFGQSVLTPIDMVSGGDIDDTIVLNIARVLQTFDSDKNPSNGITLVESATNLNLGYIDFSNNLDIQKLINEVNSTDGNLIEVNSSSAKSHLQDTFSSFTNGNDPLDINQWYLDDLNITEIHKDYNGSSANSSIIQIVDTGIEATHEDIFANLDLEKSYNAQSGSAENCTPDFGESHGTLCAGIASARGYNNRGMKGVNPLGKVVGFKFKTLDDSSFYYNYADLEKAWLSGSGANDITVSSNSWGSCFSTSTTEEDILKQGTSLLRDGKGRIYVMAAGNGRNGDDDCNDNTKAASANTTYMANNPYVITVASVEQNNRYSSFSNQGSNILISAYGSDIYTTNLNNEYSYFSGTSAATPIVAGGIALIVEACPTLTYRDVKYILAKTATKIDTSNNTWVTNSAGLTHSIDYGYGLINVANAINMCKNNYTTSLTTGNFSDTSTEVAVNSTVPDNNTIGLSTTITVTDNKKVEWVGVYIDATFDNLGEFEFELTSPAGTTTKLLHSNNALGNENINGEFRLSSVAFIDENSGGDWIVTIRDKGFNNQLDIKRTLNKIKLQTIGH
jgi:subtilisin family serine protease